MAAEEVQVLVHVIEARGLVALDSNGSAQPICSVEIGPTSSRQQATDVRLDTLNCVWEKMFSFDRVFLTPEQFECEKLAFKIYDRNQIMRNEVIGSYECSLGFIYRSKGHELYRTWVPLTHPTEPYKEWGYLLFSAYVLKKGDPIPVHDPAEEEAEEAEVLDLPSIVRKGYQLNAFIYRAADIPIPEEYCNTFVNIRFNGMTAQTKTEYNSVAPKFNTKISLPHYAPLRSDCIEVQLWNNNPGRRDTYIGSTVFMQTQVLLKSVGPLWVNLYSARHDYESVDDIEYKQHNEGSEYVGRVLLRLNVTPTERNPTLKVLPCDPMLTEPPSSEYSLRFSLYSAAEIPVLGGYLRLVVHFGNKQVESDWVLGKHGQFNWMQQLPQILVTCPDELAQIHDVVVSLQHRVGMTIEKIGFLRLSAKKLLLGSRGVGNASRNWVVNGDQLETVNELNALNWQPHWRALKHTNPDDEQKQMIAGFLLFSVGFGVSSAEPAEYKQETEDGETVEEEKKLTAADPQFYAHTRKPCKVVAHIFQGVNLPAGNPNGTSDAFLALRFGGKCLITKPVGASLSPVWNEKLEFESAFDPQAPPPVFLNVYHKERFGRVFLARSEIQLKNLPRRPTDPNWGRPQRYYLTHGQHDKSKSKSYVLASIYVLPNNSPIPAQMSDLPDMAEFAFQLQCIGLRQLAPYGYSNVGAPCMRIICPNWGAPDSVIEIDSRPAISGAVDYVSKPPPLPMFRRIKLPKTHLGGFNITIQLFDSGTFGNTLIGVAQVPVLSFLESFIEQIMKGNPEPEYEELLNLNAEPIRIEEEGGPEEDVKDEKSDSDEKTVATPASPSLNPTPEGADPNSDSTPLLGASSQDIQLELIQKDSVLETDNKLWQQLDSVMTVEDRDTECFLVLDTEKSNFCVIIENQNFHSEGRPAVKQQAKDKVQSRESKIDHELEKDLKTSTYRELVFMRGKQAGFSYLDRMLISAHGELTRQVQAGILKASLSGCLFKDFKKMQPRTIENIFSNNYVTRLYVYRAINLIPAHKWVGKPLDPYLVIRNGSGDGFHLISTREDVVEDKINPGFYKCYELDTKLPGNNELEIMVWSKDRFSDDLIGTTTIDLERRLLNEQWAEWNNKHSTPREFRDLRNISSNVAQGKIEVRLEVVPRDWARTHPPENIAPPPPVEYELRLVLWNTENVQHGDIKKRGETINQTLDVTVNWTGEDRDEIKKSTDISWSCDSETDWNCRLLFPVSIPSKIPRLKFTLWNAALIGDNEFMGEASFNLARFMKDIQDNRRTKHNLNRTSVTFKHSNYDAKIGDLWFEISCLMKSEALADPVGEYQDEPNQNPFLAAPKRNPAPYQIASKGLIMLGMLGRAKVLIAIALVLVIAGPFIIPMLLRQMQGAAI